MKKTESISDILFGIGEKLQFVPSGDPESIYKIDSDDSARETNPQRFLKMKMFIAKSSEQSLFLNIYRRFVRFIFSSKLRSYGYFFFACGLTNIFSYFLKRFVSFLYGDAHNLMFGIGLILLSVVALIDRHTLGESICNSSFYISLFYPVLGIRKWEIRAYSDIKDSPFAMILCGIAVGISGVIYTPYKVIGAIMIISATLIILFKPESGLTLSLLLMFFIGEKLLWYFVILTLVSLLLKVIIGKRNVHFCKTDFAVLGFMLLFALNSVFRFNALYLENTYRILIMMAFYFAGRMLINTVDTFKRVMFSLNMSLLIGSLFINAFGILGHFNYDVGEILSSVGFGSVIVISKEAGILIAMLCPIAAGLFRTTDKLNEKTLCILSVISSVSALFFVESGGVWVAFVCGMTAFFIMSDKKSLCYAVLILLLAITVFAFLPNNTLSLILTKTGLSKWSIANTSVAWKNGFEKLLSVLPWGLGLSPSGINTSLASGSFYIETGIIFGIVGIAAPLIFIWLFFFKCRKYARDTISKELHYAVCSVLCGVIPLVLIAIMGTVSDYKIFATFFLYLSLPEAGGRVSELERERIIF